MTAYYNENDKFAAAWLRNLIDAGLIAHGVVDERSICDVTPDDVRGFVQCHFFAGIGGWSYALRLAGWPDDRPVWTGSCPCQPFSSAGKGKGTADARHLWPEFYRLIRECRPARVFGEQVASPAGLGWLDGVFADLEGSDYACGASDLCAAGVGAPHIRQRIYWMAHAERPRAKMYTEAGVTFDGYEDFARPGPERERQAWGRTAHWDMPDGRRRCEPGALQVVDGVSEFLDEIRGYGNAIVPQVAAEFIRASVEAILLT